jgi:hypothetical protein
VRQRRPVRLECSVCGSETVLREKAVTRTDINGVQFDQDS